MILDVCAALAELMEPDLSDDARIVLDVEPLVWEKDHLYVYPLGATREEQFETGPTRMQRFDLNVVYIRDSGDEARMERSPDLALELDAKRGDYMRVVRENEHNTVWDNLTAFADNARPRGLDKRSAAVRVNGWRIVN